MYLDIAVLVVRPGPFAPRAATGTTEADEAAAVTEQQPKRSNFIFDLF